MLIVQRLDTYISRIRNVPVCNIFMAGIFDVRSIINHVSFLCNVESHLYKSIESCIVILINTSTGHDSTQPKSCFVNPPLYGHDSTQPKSCFVNPPYCTYVFPTTVGHDSTQPRLCFVNPPFGSEGINTFGHDSTQPKLCFVNAPFGVDV